MAEINIAALSHGPGIGGPDVPVCPWARISKKTWPDGGIAVNQLSFHFAHDTINVWPFVPEHAKKLGEDLIKLAETFLKK